MLIGVPKEIKNHEYRVGLTPSSVMELVKHGHHILIQHDAGAGVDFSDDQYISAGAEIVSTAEEIFARGEMIIKVKEPQPHECKMLREGQILYTYLHLAPDPDQTKLLVESGATCVAYETVTDAKACDSAASINRVDELWVATYCGCIRIPPRYRCHFQA